MPVSSAVKFNAKARKRVLIVSSSYPGSSDNVSGIFVEDQAVVLARHWDVLVYVPQFFSARGLVAGRKLPSVGIVRQREVMVLRERTLMPPLCTRFARTLRAAADRASKQLCRAIDEWGRPEVIHAHVSFPAGWIAVRAGQRLGLPVVLTEHSGPFSALTKHAPQRSLVKEALMHAHRALAVSPALADQMRAEFPDLDIQILGNVVRTDLFRPATSSISPGSFTVMAVALLAPGKGIDVLIDAIASLPDDLARTTRLVIAGDGPERERLEQRARSRGIHDRCHFAGMLHREALVRLLQQCDVFVLPSLGETFGLALAEAMACGKPVVATRCGGPDFVVRSGDGILVDPGDADAIKDALIKVSSGAWPTDPERVRKGIEERFGPDVFFGEINKIYEHSIAAAHKHACPSAND